MTDAPTAKRRKTTTTATALPTLCENFVDGAFVPPTATARRLAVTSPADGSILSSVVLSDASDVGRAVDAAARAFPAWSASSTIRTRAQILYRFRELVLRDRDLFVRAIVAENGKNEAEALGDVAKGLETVEWACSMPQLVAGRTLVVSGGGVTCRDVAEPLGVVASVAPFNFPFMVPMWTVPIALVAGNCVLLKPSEKCPITSRLVAERMKEAGVPPGVFQIVNGDAECVKALCDHGEVRALTFVGSSRVAEIVKRRCDVVRKRVLCLGGAKNHLVALEDCDVESASRDVVASFCGCAGQRCMAASVLVLVEEGNGGGSGGDPKTSSALLDAVVRKSKALERGQRKGQVGAIVDEASLRRMRKYVDEAERSGHAEVLLDGRGWMMRKAGEEKEGDGGTWFGPTILLFRDDDESSRSDPALHEEIFGPVLSVVRVKTWERAIEIENASPYGNAAAIYTTNGGSAQHFADRFRAGMIGVNIGVPVPREPFAFGGLWGTRSKFGDFDVTGEGAMRFFTRKRKVTSRWPRGGRAAAAGSGKDAASFVGKM